MPLGKKMKPLNLYKITVTRGMVGRRLTTAENPGAIPVSKSANVRKINSLRIVSRKTK